MQLYQVEYGIQGIDTKYICYTIAFSVEEAQREITRKIEERKGKVEKWYSCNILCEDIHLFTREIKKDIVYNNPSIVDEYNKYEELEKQEERELNKSIKRRKKEKEEQWNQFDKDKQVFHNNMKGEV